MRGYTAILMPDDFYLPRHSRFGQEIRDVMPMDGAITYVTDGARIGVQFRTGRVDWIMEPAGEALDAASYRFRCGALLRELRLQPDPRETISIIWRRNATAFNETAAAFAARQRRAPELGFD